MKTKGRILKDRIKQKGFTQADFADACGISLPALKKYMTDKLPYSIALLEIFAEKLDCSTAYLLGESETTMPELHDLKAVTHLSDAALSYLKMTIHDYTRQVHNSEDEDRKNFAEKELVTLSYVIDDDELLNLILKFLYFDETEAYFGEPCSGYNIDLSPFVFIGDILLYPNQVKGMLEMNIVERLNIMREKFSKIKDKSAILTEEVSENAKKCTRKWLNS